MKSNNQYLEKINESVGGQVVDERKPNNWYLRSIAKNTGSQEIHGHRTDNYYLKRIALNMEDLDVKELLETIAELRGEVEDLEELLANDIHLFSCCKDIVQTGESLGLFAYCKHDGELEGNTVYFYALEDDITDLIVRFNGKTISQTYNTTYFIGDNVVIDWGDGTTTDYTTGGYSHTYEEDGEHIITISNVIGLESSFLNKSGVVGITIPNTVISITNGAFMGTGLSEVFIPPNVKTLGSACFRGIDSLTKVTLSEGLETMGNGCFSSLNLTEITIPKSVKTMGGGCVDFTKLTNINLLWDTSETIIPYDSTVYYYGYYTITIPTGTTALYEAKGYPSDKLQER